MQKPRLWFDVKCTNVEVNNDGGGVKEKKKEPKKTLSNDAPINVRLKYLYKQSTDV